MPAEMATNETLLQHLDKNGPFNSQKYANKLAEDHQKIVGLIKSLEGLGQVISVEPVTGKHWELTDEGRQVVTSGSHEANLFRAVPENGIAQAELMSSVPNAKIGLSKAISAGWLRVEKGPGGARVCRRVDAVTDTVQQHLQAVLDGSSDSVPDKLRAEYKKRKLVQEVTSKSFNISKGAGFTLSVEKQDADLTADMLASGSWRTRSFKPYNFAALGAPPPRGHLHPLLKVRAEFRQIFLEMGFSEMPTNRWVESSFWNFDALFQPQQHPARDAHDTFFVSDPATCRRLPGDYLSRVSQVHSRGGFGSQGYGYDWKLEEAQKNLLRTHTTAVSTRMLHALAQEPEFRPVKYFSIDRVFRNETLDATHLAEFHQVEGLVADRGLTLGHLMGVIDEFFKKLGIDQVRFKPAYNPYTEPSMEIFGWHGGLGKWVEIGNSGMFRPEMLLPMGLPEDVNVIAWGLSLERPTMIKYKLDNIRDLCGHRVNLAMVSSNPICRLDKDTSAARPDPQLSRLERRQRALLSEIDGLTLVLNEVRRRRGLPPVSLSAAASPPPVPPTQEDHGQLRLAVYADPHRPPLSLSVLWRLLAAHLPVWGRAHVHSSCRAGLPPPAAALLSPAAGGAAPAAARLHLTLVWRSGGGLETRAGPRCAAPLRGETVLARLLARLLLPHRPRLYAEDAAVDAWLDDAEAAVVGGERRARAALVAAAAAAVAGRPWLLPGAEATLADVVVWSVLTQLKALTPPLARWAAAVEALT